MRACVYMGMYVCVCVFFMPPEKNTINLFLSNRLYKRKHYSKRLSDFNKIKFYQHLYHCKRKRLNKNMIKNIYWLVLGNKCEIYLFTEKMKKKKGNSTDMTLGNLSYNRMFLKRKKKEIWHDVWNLFVSVFQKILFVVKLRKQQNSE